MSRKSVSKMERDIVARYYSIKVALKALFDQRLTGREREVNSHNWHFLCRDRGEDMRLYQVNAGKFIYDMSAQEMADLLEAVQAILDDYLLDYVAEPTQKATVFASSFAAVLELVREGKLELNQKQAFAPLYFRKRPPNQPGAMAAPDLTVE